MICPETNLSTVWSERVRSHTHTQTVFSQKYQLIYLKLASIRRQAPVVRTKLGEFWIWFRIFIYNDWHLVVAAFARCSCVRIFGLGVSEHFIRFEKRVLKATTHRQNEEENASQLNGEWIFCATRIAKKKPVTNFMGNPFLRLLF